MKRVTFLAIAFLSFSLTVQADEPVSCNLIDSRSSSYYRDISYAQFGDVVDIKVVLRNKLLEYTKEVERIATWDKKYSGPDKDYIPVLVDILNHSTGLHHEFSCFWDLVEDGDVVRKFTDNETMVFREGYGLFRKGSLIAYFYSGVAVV